MLARRPVIALVVAIAIWAPSLKAFVSGAVDIFPVATRFLVAFGVAYVGVTILGMVVAGYGQAVSADQPRRRRQDAMASAAVGSSLSDPAYAEAALPGAGALDPAGPHPGFTDAGMADAGMAEDDSANA